jgi:hypothetical protein
LSFSKLTRSIIFIIVSHEDALSPCSASHAPCILFSSSITKGGIFMFDARNSTTQGSCALPSLRSLSQKMIAHPPKIQLSPRRSRAKLSGELQHFQASSIQHYLLPDPPPGQVHLLLSYSAFTVDFCFCGTASKMTQTTKARR